MKSLATYKEEQMKNPEFVKEYMCIQAEMEKIRADEERKTYVESCNIHYEEHGENGLN